MNMMMMFPLLVLIIFTWSGVSSQFCTGEFTCDQGLVYAQVQGVHSVEECQHLCSDDALCHAFTHWSHLSVIHWSQCWKFQECGDQLQCEQCVSGVSGGDCDLSTTTVSTVSGAGCPPLTSDQETGMTCFPDYVSGMSHHCLMIHMCDDQVLQYLMVVTVSGCVVRTPVSTHVLEVPGTLLLLLAATVHLSPVTRVSSTCVFLLSWTLERVWRAPTVS